MVSRRNARGAIRARLLVVIGIAALVVGYGLVLISVMTANEAEGLVVCVLILENGV